MQVIEINVAGICDKFYDVFFEKLKSNKNFELIEYIPCTKKEYSLRRQKKHKVIYAPIKTSLDRIFLDRKTSKYKKYLENYCDMSKVNLIHAHSLFSDGMVALKLHNLYNIPYIVAFRATDEEIFLKYFLMARKYMKDIVLNAEKVIFINPSCYERMLNKYTDIFNCKKVDVIPNGVDDYWLENINNEIKHITKKEINILQVSRLVKVKNIDKSIKAVKVLIDNGYKVHFNVVGKGREKENLLKLVAKKNLEEKITFYDYIDSKEKMLNIYRENDIFLLPSKNETFGISYIEALSQGLPIIGMNNGGVSGFFKNNSAFSGLNSSKPKEIAENIKQMINNYDNYSKYCLESINQFNWNFIIKQYKDLYMKICDRRR